jgi:hypothetical protein
MGPTPYETKPADNKVTVISLCSQPESPGQGWKFGMMGPRPFCKEAHSRSDKVLLFRTIAVIRRYSILRHNLAGPFLANKVTANGGLLAT